jgi:ATP-dependent Lhr-like helicase
MVVDYLAVGRAVLGAMPTQERIVFERFFDETGGMQLVVHSPFGGRVNRSLGLALRKKFCRTFNFELQAAASDDAIVLSLGPHHSFPLSEVPGYLSSSTVEDTLEHAILDSPMFQARWRWNLNRSLMVLRFRNGRRNPPPIQRMESDDLMAAVFPQAAACQENVTGPIEIPDHVLVRQTISDTLHEALDVDGTRGLLQRMESGAVQVHFADTTEPSVLAHEILTARPYAFLDDEELQNRRTNAVTLRRGLAVDLAAIGALDPAAIEQVHGEITPEPESSDDLADLLASLVVVRPRPEWLELFEELRARNRAVVFRPRDTDLWCSAEREDDAGQAFADDEDAIAQVLRGHLEISGITTVERLVEDTTLTPGRVTAGLAYLEQSGFALQGSYTPEARDTEWVSRRLLARMHSYSRRTRRGGVEPATAQDFMRFLLRWQHVAPGHQLAGEVGLLTVVEQLQGFDAAAVAWEPDLLGARLRRYDPAWLDRLCHDGEVAWLRTNPPPRAVDAPAVAPSKATPISLVARVDLPWLLMAARATGDPGEPVVGATAEVIEVLRDRGACFATELGAATNRLPEDIERALWDGVARGLVMSDGFGAIRSRVASNGRRSSESRRFSRLTRGPRVATAAAGRWSLVPTADAVALSDLAAADRDELAEAVAELLLHRWGVVFRDLVQHDSLRFPWRDLQWALRRLEDRGLVRGGRFVSGFSGEQYALPAAHEQLNQVRRAPRESERVTVNATDPLNLVGVIVPGARVPAVRTRRVTFVDGVVESDATADDAVDARSA